MYRQIKQLITKAISNTNTYKIPFVYNNNNKQMLGRWNLKHKDANKQEIISVFWANSDHCGDVICGDLQKNKEILDKKLKELGY